MRAKLTDLSVSSLKPPARGQFTCWDTVLRGFGIRVSVAGAKSWVIMTGRDRKLSTLGRYPGMSLKDARVAAKLASAQPSETTASVTVREALDTYFSATEKRVRPKTLYDYRRSLNKHLAPIVRRQLRDLTTDGVMRIIDGLHKTPIEQLHAFLIATTFFRFCVRRRMLDRSPLHGIELPGKFNERDRVLDDSELVTVYHAAERESYPFGPIVLLCIFTGQRRGEIGKLRWEYIDQKEQTITLPGSITKNGLTHTFPYGPMVKAVLDDLPETGGFLFPGRVYNRSTANDPQRHFEGWSRGKENFDKRCPVLGWTLHDLRRTYRTTHAKIGTPPHIAERLVNHVSVTSPVSKIYDRYSYLPEMRKAVEAYETHLAAVLAQKQSVPRAA
jgi:integrase